MRLTLTGSSSTGKTTLALELIKNPEFPLEFVSADARALLHELGYRSMDKLTRKQLREFQCLYLKRKLELEIGRASFLTERSSVDVAAYWLVRDAFDLPAVTREAYIQKCKMHALSYDLHVYLPFGLIPFISDGYRSEDLRFHERIDHQIQVFLNDWNINYVTLNTSDLHTRIETVVELLKDCDSK